MELLLLQISIKIQLLMVIMEHYKLLVLFQLQEKFQDWVNH